MVDLWCIVYLLLYMDGSRLVIWCTVWGKYGFAAAEKGSAACKELGCGQNKISKMDGGAAPVSS